MLCKLDLNKFLSQMEINNLTANLFGCHRNGAAHREHQCWHGDPSGSWEGKCGPGFLKTEDTLELLK